MDTVKLAHDEVHACLARAGSFYSRTFWITEILFNLSGSTAGQFQWSRDLTSQRIRLNRILLDQNPQEMLRTIIPHEVAHLVACQLYGPKVGHGPRWKQIMMNCFNLPPDRCHDLDTSLASAKPFIYRCGCKAFNISTRMHKQMERGQLRHCKACKQPLAYSHVEEVEKVVLRMEKLFLAAHDNRLSRTDIQRVTGLIGGHKLGRLVIQPSLAVSRRELLSALSLTADRCLDHPRPDTLPGGLTHAILFADSTDTRMKRAAAVLRDRGVKVRVVARSNAGAGATAG
ncbi:hypothetical protein EGJ28_21320 [Stutzerimonas xanthomarina]|jgi:SprT protein|uniref:SprT-like domain-containing protein n=1 Tax=Stutzerimonas xanthomarina TaxID=271420 RepID=A0A427DPI3_9GAMM|nr:hypothetical protein QX25_18090 [Stutzerimonas stutzeri]MBK3919888.1 hypothetical protein [Stutzerimonas frequens]RRV05481.1 hypothetical protein EGJ28_21320 [Stutzerimonas xanthomarina]